MSVRTQTWLIVGGLVAAIFLANPYGFIPDPRGPAGTNQPKPDFLAFYSAGTLLRHDPSHLYDDERQAEIQSAVLREQIEPDLPGFMPFVYPALMAVPFVLLAALPYSTAFVAMLSINVLLLGFALELLSTTFQLGVRASRLLVLCAAVSIPVILTIANGQVSFLPFIIVIMVIGNIRTDRNQSGIWTGLLAIKPTLMPVFVLWFLVRRKWRSLVYAAVTASLILLSSVLLTGPQAIRGYLSMSAKMAGEQYATVNSARMPNLKALSEFLGYSGPAWIVLAGLLLVLLMARARDTSKASCASLILATLLVAPHIHYQDLNPLWIVAALGLTESRITVGQRWALIAGTLSTTALVFVLASHQSNLPVFPVGLLAAFLASTLFRNRISERALASPAPQEE